MWMRVPLDPASRMAPSVFILLAGGTSGAESGMKIHIFLMTSFYSACVSATSVLCGKEKGQMISKSQETNPPEQNPQMRTPNWEGVVDRRWMEAETSGA